MSKEKLLVATRNQKKTVEIRGMLKGYLDVLDVTELEATGKKLPEIEETGTTFSENATLKAVGISREVEGWVLADDSGLEVDGLGGEPGVYSSSYGGEEGNHLRNNQRLSLDLMSLEAAERKGRFRCVMVLAKDGKVRAEFAGVVEDELISEPRGEEGFGYDPYFVPEEYVETFAELGLEVKNAMSHRGRALGQVREWLAAELG